MRALLVLFLVDQVQRGGFGLDDRTATAIYGLYGAGVYLAAMPGGWIADRLIGAQAAVFWGGALIALGHLVLAVAGSIAPFMLGLAVIVLGTGLLKPNVSALVAELHPGGGARRDAAFTLFYMAINIGAMIGPIVTAWLALHYGWHVGFLRRGHRHGRWPRLFPDVPVTARRGGPAPRRRAAAHGAPRLAGPVERSGAARRGRCAAVVGRI